MNIFLRWLLLLKKTDWLQKLQSLRSFWWGSLSLCAVLGLHTGLFYLFEKGHHSGKVSLFSSFWVTLTTFTTVGYGDISAVTVGGRWTTIVLGYILGLSLFAWFAGYMVSQLFERTDLRRRGMVPLKLQNHTLIVHVPSEQKVRLLVERLRQVQQEKSTPLVIVSDDVEALPFSMEKVYFVRGNTTSPETYRRASIESASRAIVLAKDNENPSSDAVTAGAVAVIESINPRIHTIAECLFESHFLLFRHVRCDQIVYTGDILVKLLVQETEDAGAAKAISQLLEPQGNEFYSVPLGSHAVGKTFRELLRQLIDKEIAYLPVGYLRDKEVELNPSRDSILELGDHLIFLGSEMPSWSTIEPQLFPDQPPNKAPDNSKPEKARSKKRKRR